MQPEHHALPQVTGANRIWGRGAGLAGGCWGGHLADFPPNYYSLPHSPWMFWGLSMTKFPFQTTDKLTGRSLISFPS